MKICQWGSDDQELRKFLKLLEDKGGYSRAATVAIFCLQIRLATQILQRGGEKHDRELSVVAMALSGIFYGLIKAKSLSPVLESGRSQLVSNQ